MNYYSAILLSSVVFFTAQDIFAENSTTLAKAIDRNEKSSKSIATDSREAGDFLTARTAQELLLLLSSFEASNEKQLEAAFESVDKERRGFIGAIESAVTDLNRGVVNTTDRSERVVDEAHQLLKAVTSDSFPTVFRFRGTVVFPGDQADIRLRVRGNNFEYGEPYIELDGQSYPASRPTTKELVIKIPRGLFIHDDEVMVVKTGTLHLPYETGGFFGLFSSDRAIVHEINFVVLPKFLGHTKVQYDVLGTERREVVETGIWHENAPSGCRSFRKRIPAGQEKRSDGGKPQTEPHSVKQLDENRHNSYRDPDVYMKICADPEVADSNGRVKSFRYKIVESWLEPTRTPTVTEQQVNWEADSTITIHENADNLLFTFTDFSGRETEHTPSSNPEARYGQVSFDEPEMVLFRPIIPKYLTAERGR